MDDRRVGALIRALRRRFGWRQEDLGERAHVSQGLISLLERGHIEQVSLRTIRAVLRALEAGADLEVRWRGGAIDRLTDERHASLAGAVARRLTALGWDVFPEISYSEYGERGLIDLLAWRSATRTLLIVEIKSELTSVEATLRKHDEKVRLAPRIAATRFGWRAAAVARLLVLPAESTARRHVGRHADVLDRALPARGDVVRAWLRTPTGPLAGLLFVPDTNPGSARQGGVTRVRTRKAS